MTFSNKSLDSVETAVAMFSNLTIGSREGSPARYRVVGGTVTLEREVARAARRGEDRVGALEVDDVCAPDRLGARVEGVDEVDGWTEDDGEGERDTYVEDDREDNVEGVHDLEEGGEEYVDWEEPW